MWEICLARGGGGLSLLTSLLLEVETWGGSVAEGKTGRWKEWVKFELKRHKERNLLVYIFRNDSDFTLSFFICSAFCTVLSMSLWWVQHSSSAPRRCCFCGCVCERVIKVKCWCLVQPHCFAWVHLYTETHTVWPAVIEMCSVSSWIDPEDCDATAASNSCQNPLPSSLCRLLPLALLSFTFCGSWSAVCQCSSINWVPDWLLVFAVAFLSPFNR